MSECSDQIGWMDHNQNAKQNICFIGAYKSSFFFINIDATLTFFSRFQKRHVSYSL